MGINRLRYFHKCTFEAGFFKEGALIYHRPSGIKIKAMNALQNKVQLIGNLGNNPEIKTIESGKKLARFSIATHEFYHNNKGEKAKQTIWHQVIAWGKLAEIAEKYLSKGSEVAIEGKLIHGNYLDKDGNKKYFTEVQVNDLLLLGAKQEVKEERHPEPSR